MRSRFTDIVGCEVPIQQAGMGNLARPRLAAAVASAGALGMLGGIPLPPASYVAKMLDDTRGMTKGVFGITFIGEQWKAPGTGEFDPEAISAIKTASSRARVVEFSYADPDPVLVDLVHHGGALAAWQVGSKGEALSAERAGCDFVVAQGLEAGGHLRGKLPLEQLLAQVIPDLRVPVVAAGGIGNGAAMSRTLRRGASAVRIGTRFVAAEESEAHHEYVRRLIESDAKDTVVTNVFSTNWSNGPPHRVLGECVEAMKRLPEGPIGGQIVPWEPDVREPILRGDALVVLNSTTGHIEGMPHWAGMSVSDVKSIQPAAEIVRELVQGAERAVSSSTV